MFDLKPLSEAGVSEALEKALRYRLLNEPRSAESICLDILEVEPDKHEAVVTLILAITDQFALTISSNVSQARDLLPRLKDAYERHYYAGIISERRGKAVFNRGLPGGKSIAYQSLRDAMSHFEKAEAVQPPGNDDAILRWNSCARLIMQHNLELRQDDTAEPYLE